MEPIDSFAGVRENGTFLLLVFVLLGTLYALVQFRRNQRKRMMRGRGPGGDSIREHTMRTLAEKLGLTFELADFDALGADCYDLRLFRQAKDVGLKIQKTADRILGGMFEEVAPFQRLRNVVKGIVDDSTITILDHHFSPSRPRAYQTIVILRSCRVNVPHITIRPKTKVDGVTSMANADRIEISENRAFLDHYVVESSHRDYSHQMDGQFVAELARTPFLWIEAKKDIVAICRHGSKADLDEILALLTLAMTFKNSLAKVSASYPSMAYGV